MAQADTHTSPPIGKLAGLIQAPSVRRFLKWSAGVVLGLGLLGFFAAPPLLQMILVKQLSAYLHREVSIENIDINPFALTTKIDGLSVKDVGGKEAVGFDEFFVNLSVLSIAQAAPIVDEIHLRGLRVAVARVADGKYDISDLLDEWMKPAEPDVKSSLPRFSVNNIQLLDARLVFDDQPVGKVHTVSAINLRLPFISSMAYKADALVTPYFSANFGDAPILLEAVSKPFSEGRESEIRVDIDKFNLASLQPYVPSTVPLHLVNGTVDSELTLIFKELSDQLFSLTVAGAVHLSEFKVTDAENAPLLGWKRLDVDIENADLVNRKIAVKEAALDGLETRLSVNRNGELNALLLLEQLAGTPAKGKVKSEVKEAESETGLEWTLGEFRLSNGLVHWKDDSNPTPVHGEVRNLNVQVGKIESKLVAPIEIVEASYQIDLGERMRVDSMVAKNIKVDLHGHRVDIGEVTNSGTRAQVLRTREGKIDWVSSPLLKTVKKAEAELSDERIWIGSVGKLKISDLSLRFEDQSTSPVAVQVIDGFDLSGENLSSEPNKTGKIALNSRINQKGSLKVDGSLQIFPLQMNLRLETGRVSILPLQPYFADQLNITLRRGQISSKGDVSAEIGEQGFKASYQGSLTVGDLVTVDNENQDVFLQWRSLYFGGLDFHLQPMALNVGEIALTDFFSRLIIDPKGQLNLAKIVKKPTPEAGEPPESPVGQPPLAESEPAQAPRLPIKIAQITLQNGTVDFSDLFVKPNFSVKLAKLGGRLSGLSTDAEAIADMDLRATYGGSAPVQILAKLNPLAAKPYLDLKADITGVDMVGFSPYSGKYAGYNIEKGKLSLNVSYKLENDQLAAENKLFIDQFTFGEKVESPDATQLPVNLAVSLLKNNRGEIDLDLPIAGSLDDPQFSLGGLILKVIINLFVKAVTSPFALLGAMVGGGEELSVLEFASGRSSLDPAGSKKLESLAKALNDRAALKLDISGRADPEADKEGIKQAAMVRAVKREKLKDLQKKQGEAASLEEIELTAEEYPVYLKLAYKEAEFPKPRNLLGLLKDIPQAEMEKLMLTNTQVSAEDVRALAIRRAETAQLWLVEQGKVAAERVFLLPPKIEVDPKGKASRVDFSLR